MLCKAQGYTHFYLPCLLLSFFIFCADVFKKNYTNTYAKDGWVEYAVCAMAFLSYLTDRCHENRKKNAFNFHVYNNGKLSPKVFKPALIWTHITSSYFHIENVLEL